MPDESVESLNIPIETLDLPPRVYRCLKTTGIHTVEQVLQTGADDLLRIRHFGRRSLTLLKAHLRRRGIEFNPAEKNEARTTDLTVILGMPVEQCGFSDNMIERLHLAQIDRLGELVTKTPELLIRFPSIGPRSLQIIRHVLSDFGLRLGMDFVPADSEGKKWLDRLDDARTRLASQLKTPADLYFFSKEYRITQKTLTRFLKNLRLNAYESSRLRSLFSGKIDLFQPWDFRRLDSCKRMMRIELTYRQTQSLHETARQLRLSHEQVRQILKLGDSLNLFSYQPGL